MNKMNKLNTNVSAAIGKVKDAETELAHAELALAIATFPDTLEGEVARRGAVRAAVNAGLDDLVDKLLKTFLSEEQADDKLKAELKRIASREPRGKWYLVYTYTNEMEAGTFRDGVEDEEIVLNANTEGEAIVEAGTKWSDILAKSIARWEEQKKTWKHPPASPSEWGARNPRIIYRIPM